MKGDFPTPLTPSDWAWLSQRYERLTERVNAKRNDVANAVKSCDISAAAEALDHLNDIEARRSLIHKRMYPYRQYDVACEETGEKHCEPYATQAEAEAWCHGYQARAEGPGDRCSLVIRTWISRDGDIWSLDEVTAVD